MRKTAILNERLTVFIICIVMSVSVFFVYRQVTGFDFVSFDDPVYVRDNPIVRNGLSMEGIKWAFLGVYAANWHPLTWLSHMADVQIFGMNPGMHHLVNVLLHLMNSVLLFIMLRNMTGKLWRSALVAALFAVHPVHVESVAWISERKDVLSTLFWMLATMAYVRYVRHRSFAGYLLVAFLFALGLMAKPMLVTLPFTLLLLDIWPLGRLRPSLNPDNRPFYLQVDPRKLMRLVLEKVPLMVMASAACAETFYAQTAGGAVSALDRIGLMARLQNAAIAYLAYLLKTVCPMNLAAFYPYPTSFNLLVVLLSLLLIVLISTFVIKKVRTRTYLFTGWFWYLGTLVPVIGFVQAGSQSMADRYTYIPLIGIFIMCIWGAKDLLSRYAYRTKVLYAAAAPVLAILAFLANSQVNTWKDSETLFRHALSVTAGNYLAHNSLGVALHERGDIDGAISHYREAARINPMDVKTRCNLGVALAKKKNYMEAFVHYRECLKIKPGYSEAHYNMGVAYAETGHMDEAIRQYRSVLARYPNHENALNNLGVLLAKKGDFDGAIAQYEKALETNPDSVRTRINLADVLLKKDRTREALDIVNKALERNPGEKGLLIKIAEIDIRNNNMSGAEAAYAKALEIDPQSTKALYGAVLLYASQKRYDDALKALGRLKAIKPSDPSVDYDIACVYSRQGRSHDAITHLHKALENGFKDLDMLLSDKDLDNVKNMKAFTDLKKRFNDLKKKRIPRIQPL